MILKNILGSSEKTSQSEILPAGENIAPVSWVVASLFTPVVFSGSGVVALERDVTFPAVATASVMFGA